MKNITLSADEDLIEQARLVARSQRKTLNAAFREWLLQFTGKAGSRQEFDSLMRRLRRETSGRRFTRDEMNERKVLPRHERLCLFVRPERSDEGSKAASGGHKEGGVFTQLLMETGSLMRK